MRGRTWWFGIVLGGLLIALGIMEVVRLVVTGDGGFAFWFGTLVGGGLLILAGTLMLPRKPTNGFILTTTGCVAGLLPTIWTLVVPLLLVALIFAAAKQAAVARAEGSTPG